METMTIFNKSGVKFTVGTNFNDVILTFKEYTKDKDTNTIQVQIWKDNKAKEYLGITLGGGMDFGMETSLEDLDSIEEWWQEEWTDSFEDDLEILV